MDGLNDYFALPSWFSAGSITIKPLRRGQPEREQINRWKNNTEWKGSWFLQIINA